MKHEKYDMNSMLYWWPIVRDLDIPMPATEMVEVGDITGMLDGDMEGISSVMGKLKEAAAKIGYPLFLRTDLQSAKHDWEWTCYLEKEDDMMSHIGCLVDDSGAKDLDVNALVFREYIPMASMFRAFRNMPVSPERRYFIRNGLVECHHPYWPEEAIHGRNLPDGWERMLKDMNCEAPDEQQILWEYAATIAQRINGYWSVDFCKAEDGRWIFIEMALGEGSWHPECPLNKEA